jgi:RHS repeat-associated protein
VRLAILERPGNTVKSSGREAHLGRLSQPPSSKTFEVVRDACSLKTGNRGSRMCEVRRLCVFKLPFGEELGVGIGSRSGGQGYGASDTNSWKYGMLQRDAATGLDHTWFRKYESTSGRWTSPDPLHGGLADPQSFNGYNYSGNDPVNSVDPSGLDPQDPSPTPHIDPATGLPYPGGVPGINAGMVTITGARGGNGSGSGGGGSGLHGPLLETDGYDPQSTTPSVRPSQKLPGCKFDISLAANKLLDSKHLQVMKDEIIRVFATAGQEVNFVSSGADYSLNINTPGVAYTNKPNAVGITDLSGSAVTMNGRVFVDRLIRFATIDPASSQAFNQNSNALAIGLARAGSHEIAHYLLQQNFDSPAIQGVMHDGFKGAQWFSESAKGLWKFTPTQIKQLNSLCGR